MVHRTDHDFVKHTLYLFDSLAKLRRVFDSTKQKYEYFDSIKNIVLLLIEVSFFVFSLTFYGVFASMRDKY